MMDRRLNGCWQSFNRSCYAEAGLRLGGYSIYTYMHSELIKHMSARFFLPFQQQQRMGYIINMDMRLRPPIALSA